MIGSIAGSIKERWQQGNAHFVLVDVQGIGYEIQVSAPIDLAIESISLYTHLKVTESALLLYGFQLRPERELFREMIAVSGVGPQTAITLISELGKEKFVHAIVSNRHEELKRVKGVGAKMAATLCLELGKKMQAWAKALDIEAFDTLIPREASEDIQMTMAALGYTANEIQTALEYVATLYKPGRTPEDPVALAISFLS